MSIQDSIQENIDFNFNEIDETIFNFDKEMEEIDNLINEMNNYHKKEITDLIPFFVFLCYYVENINYNENRIIEYEKYFYSNTTNLYYQYLNLIDCYVRIILLDYQFHNYPK